jgi:carbamoyl-phosphate synthase small subunit
MKQARLALEDGMIFYGESFGALGSVGGEVVFNTGMTGYQEILTDPSYSGQIITMTYPLIGNYGLNQFDYESDHPFARGLVVRECCAIPSNWRSEICIGDFLKKYQIPGICGIDTRALTKRLRTEGTMKGILTTEADSDPELLAKVKALPALSGQNFVKIASTAQPYTVGNGSKSVVLIDYGAKGNIVQCLVDRGCKVTVVPCDTSVSAILDLNPAGIMLSNGLCGGDRQRVNRETAGVRDLSRPPDYRPGFRGRYFQVEIRPPGRQSSGKRFNHRKSDDYLPKSWLCGSAGILEFGGSPRFAS